MAIWMDMTNSLKTWQGGVVGIIRAELEIAKNMKQENPELRFCVSSESGITEISSDSLTWLWESDSVSDAYIEHMGRKKKKSVIPQQEVPQGLISARNFSEGRLERIRRAGNLWIGSLSGVIQSITKVFFRIGFCCIKIASKIRLQLKKKKQVIGEVKPFTHPFESGDVIFSCGWNNSDKERQYSKVKANVKNISLVYLVYDMVLAKEEFKPYFQETAEFEWYITWIANNCDYIFYGGNTAKCDTEQYFKENHLPIKPGYIVKFGSEIVKKRDGLSVEKVLDKYGIEDNYILAVGSIAPKKNYATIYKAYTIMMHKYSKTKIPQLVIVGGKFGGGFLSECIEKDPLIAGKIIMIAPDDEELDILYRSCKFTILPTLYEGWSLTLPESLAYNKFCLSSNVAPLKEIAGELVDYVEPMDVSGWAEKVHYYANNPQKVEEYVSRIKAEWTPITWKDCGKTVNDYLTEINSESSKEESSIYYDMTLAWQLSLSGAGVSGILRTQLLLARYLCYKLPSMRLCAFTEFGYVDLDRYTIGSLLKNEDIERAFQYMQIQTRKLYSELQRQYEEKKTVKLKPEKRKVYKEIFWLLCSCMPGFVQRKVIEKWNIRNEKKCPYPQEFSKNESSIKYEIPLKNGDILFSTGVGFGTEAYEALLKLKEKEGFKFIQLLYDFTPILFPQLHQKGTCENYTPFLKYTYQLADVVFYGGKTAMHDGERYQKDQNFPIKPGTAIMFGSNIVRAKNNKDEDKYNVLEHYGINGPYIMAVGSIEARKNYETLYYAYIEMMKMDTELPQMVFCGYPGWKTEEFLSILNRDERVRGKIIILTPNDRELDILYQNCEFTMLASIYEGWSLTLPESLNYGKFCLTSDVEPLREIGKDFVEYVEVFDIYKWAEKILFYHKNQDILKQKEDYIQRLWHSISWYECATQVERKLLELIKEN